jgi:hypothetical protein
LAPIKGHVRQLVSDLVRVSSLPGLRHQWSTSGHTQAIPVFILMCVGTHTHTHTYTHIRRETHKEERKTHKHTYRERERRN